MPSAIDAAILALEETRIGCVPDSKLALVIATSAPQFSALENDQAVAESCGNSDGLLSAEVHLHEGTRIGCVPDSKLALVIATSAPQFSAFENDQAVVRSCGELVHSGGPEI